MEYQKAAERTGDLIVKRIPNKITGLSKKKVTKIVQKQLQMSVKK